MLNGEDVVRFPERKTIPGDPGREIQKEAPCQNVRKQKNRGSADGPHEKGGPKPVGTLPSENGRIDK